MALEFIGVIAACFSTGSFAPQVFRAWKTRSTVDLSWVWLGMTLLGILLWLAYGIVVKDMPLIIANTIVSLLSITLIIQKYVYDKDDATKSIQIIEADTKRKSNYI